MVQLFVRGPVRPLPLNSFIHSKLGLLFLNIFNATLFEVIGRDKDDNITNDEYRVIVSYNKMMILKLLLKEFFKLIINFI